MTAAEDLARTEAESAALARLREITGESGGPMERHGLRVFLIADRLATARDATVDRELLLIAGLLHDIGLYDEASHGGVYVRESAEFTAELLGQEGWDQDRIRLCFDAIERHHELRLSVGSRRGGRTDPSRRPGRPDLWTCSIRPQPRVVARPLEVSATRWDLPDDRPQGRQGADSPAAAVRSDLQALTASGSSARTGA